MVYVDGVPLSDLIPDVEEVSTYRRLQRRNTALTEKFIAFTAEFKVNAEWCNELKEKYSRWNPKTGKLFKKDERRNR